MSTKKRSKCAHCNKRPLFHCGNCKVAKYCSATCQTIHWKSGHKKECKIQSESNTKPFDRLCQKFGLQHQPSFELIPTQIKSIDEVGYVYNAAFIPKNNSLKDLFELRYRFHDDVVVKKCFNLVELEVRASSFMANIKHDNKFGVFRVLRHSQIDFHEEKARKE
eukprot:375899_1